MFNLNFLGVALVALAVGLLGVITYANNRGKAANKVFALLCGLASSYVVVNYFADFDQARALFWVRGTFALAVSVIYLMYLFVDIFPKPTFGPRWRNAMLALAAVMVGICYLPGFVSGVRLQPDHSEVITGPLYGFFIAYVIICFLTILTAIIISLRRTGGVARQRIWYVAVGLISTVICTATTNLILPLVQGNNDYAQWGSYFVLIFFGAASFSIIRHRLFDIRLLVARTLAYLALLLTFSGIYGFGLFGASTYLFPGHEVGRLQLAYYTATAILLAFTIQPLRRFFEKITESLFYRDRYDSQEVLSSLGKILISEFKLERLMSMTLSKICISLDIAYGQMYILNEGKVYRLEHYGPLPVRNIPLDHLSSLRKRLLVADEMEPGKDKEMLDRYDIRVGMQLHAKQEFVGFLLLGDKLSGDIYTSQDIDLLEIFIQELAVAISNARAYEEIAAFNTTLQQRVEEATRRLRAANRHLKELDEAKDEFISMASHQLRTPLTSIKGYLSMLAEEDAGPMDKLQKEFIGYAYDSSERMVALIADLLNVSRMSAGKFVLDSRPCNLAAIVADEIKRLQGHAVAKDLDLVFIPPQSKLPVITIDEDKTRQVIMNFIDNALYYTKQGRVVVTLAEVGGALELRVKDSGIGVPRAERAKLFHKFYRADNAQKVRPDGTGLGLFMAKRVVEDQGGTIIFESTEGKGSTFGFRLPLEPLRTGGKLGS